MADAPFNLGALINPEVIQQEAKKKQEEEELLKLQEQEARVLQQMGISPTMRRDELIQKDWGSKGKLGKLGAILSEAFRGAAQGGNYTPFSERKFGEAIRDDAAQRPYLQGQLEGVVSQKREREKSKTAIEKALYQLMGTRDTNDVRAQGLANKQAQFDATLPGITDVRKTQADVNKARASLLGSQMAKTAVQTEGIGIDNVNKSNIQGATSEAALTMLRAQNPTLNEKIYGIKVGDAKAKAAAAKPKSGGAAVGSSRLVDAVMENPLIFDTLTPRVRTEISAELQQRGFKHFGKLMGEGAIDQVAASKSSLSSLDELRKTLQDNQQYIGPIKGLEALNPWSPARVAKQQIDLVRQRVGKALEGGVLRKEDEQKYKSILATLTDTPETALAKVDFLIDNINKDMEIYKNEQRSAGRKTFDPVKPGVKSESKALSGKALSDWLKNQK
jgi:hypothetical protein